MLAIQDIFDIFLLHSKSKTNSSGGNNNKNNCIALQLVGNEESGTRIMKALNGGN
jgi:hypothetical protein